MAEEKAMLFDATKCTGCRGCQTACKAWNDLLAVETENTGSYENPPDLSTSTWLKMKFDEYSDSAAPGGLAWLFTRRSCMHCTDAACVNVCEPGALYHHEMGFVGYDKDKCSGCGYCISACPFDVPRAWDGGFWGSRKVQKCIFCADRVTNLSLGAGETACAKACPTGALAFGERSELVTAGEDRVAALKARNSSLYADANLYGKNELDGLHVMYVLPYEPTVHGLPADPQVPAASSIVDDALPVVAAVAVGAVAVGLGVNYIVARARMSK
jgi:formate dehydrogenase iron-sulfur subunit